MVHRQAPDEWQDRDISPLDEDTVEFAQILKAIRTSWRLVAGAAILGGVVAGAASFLATPVYRSEVLVQIQTTENGAGSSFSGLLGGLGGAARLAGLSLAPEQKSAILATLMTRSQVGRFIKERSLKPILFDDRLDKATKKWADPDDVPTEFDAYELFVKDVLEVDEDLKTGLVTVSVTWKDRALAAAWAKGYLDQVDEFLRQRTIREAEARLEFLNREIAKIVITEVRTTLSALVRQELETISIARASKEFALRVLDAPVVSDEDEYVRPRRKLLSVIGIIIGLLAGLFFAVARAPSAKSGG